MNFGFLIYNCVKMICWNVYALFFLLTLFYSHSCLSKLKSMDPTASSDAFSPLIQCLVSWGKGNDVIRLISDWLEAAINQTDKDRESEEEEEESEDQVTMEIVYDAFRWVHQRPTCW